MDFVFNLTYKHILIMLIKLNALIEEEFGIIKIKILIEIKIIKNLQIKKQFNRYKK